MFCYWKLSFRGLQDFFPMLLGEKENQKVGMGLKVLILIF
jgi:hypothetical protein